MGFVQPVFDLLQMAASFSLFHASPILPAFFGREFPARMSGSRGCSTAEPRRAIHSNLREPINPFLVKDVFTVYQTRPLDAFTSVRSLRRFKQRSRVDFPPRGRRARSGMLRMFRLIFGATRSHPNIGARGFR